MLGQQPKHQTLDMGGQSAAIHHLRMQVANIAKSRLMRAGGRGGGVGRVLDDVYTSTVYYITDIMILT